MPTVLTGPRPSSLPPTESDEKLWTREESRRLAQEERFAARRWELIEGRLLEKMSQGRLHSVALLRLAIWLESVFGREFVQTQTPIDVSLEDAEINEPEPDLVALRRSALEIEDRNPRPDEIALVVEAADSSLATDLGVKARLYARAGIQEYWVADLRRRRIVAHRSPSGDSYGQIVAFDADDEISTLAYPDQKRRVAAVLSPSDD